jgi:ketosteroid isomerase-like protein
MSQENVEIVRRGYEAFNKGDLEGMVASFAPDFEYVASGAIPDADGIYRGLRSTNGSIVHGQGVTSRGEALEAAGLSA